MTTFNWKKLEAYKEAIDDGAVFCHWTREFKDLCVEKICTTYRFSINYGNDFIIREKDWKVFKSKVEEYCKERDRLGGLL